MRGPESAPCLWGSAGKLACRHAAIRSAVAGRQLSPARPGVQVGADGGQERFVLALRFFQRNLDGASRLDHLGSPLCVKTSLCIVSGNNPVLVCLFNALVGIPGDLDGIDHLP